MDRIRRVERFIRENDLLHPGDTVLLGLSGGADSVFLMYALLQIREKMKLSLYAMHIQHGIRGEEAERDLMFSKCLSEKEGIPFFYERMDVPGYAGAQHISEEEAARLLRYRALRRVLSSLSGENRVLAVAHHMDDQAETVLHHLIRGAGLRGLRGMQPRNEDVIRPLLCLTKAEILSELKNRKISYMIDSTNRDIQYTRNRLRHSVLPQLSEVNAGAVRHIAESAALLSEAEAYFEEEAARFLRRWGERAGERELRLPIPALKEQPSLLRRYVLMGALRSLCVPEKDWTAVHLRDLEALVFKAGGAHIDLPYRMSADKVKKELVLRVNDGVISVQRKGKKYE